MDFIDQVKELSDKVSELIEHVEIEEATKNALIMPFIRALGYDVFNPKEVKPEYTCDFAEKQGKKVDYAIIKDGKPFMLFECKAAHVPLNNNYASQLHHYFADTDAKCAVLTNGVIYKFYTDIEKPNVMDTKPFLEFDMHDIDYTLVKELEAYGKDSSVGTEELHKRAKKLKYSKQVKEIFEKQLDTPHDDFVNFFTGLVYSGEKTEPIEKEFKGIIPDALKEFIAKKCKEPVSPPPPPVNGGDGDGKMDIKTMQLEFWNGFNEYAQSKNTSLQLTPETKPQHWYTIRIDRQKARIDLSINTKSNVLTCEIYIPNSKELFNELIKYKDEIEDELNETLEWMGQPDKNVRRIKISKTGNIKEIDKKREHFEWFKTQAELFKKVFPKYIK